MPIGLMYQGSVVTHAKVGQDSISFTWRAQKACSRKSQGQMRRSQSICRHKTSSYTGALAVEPPTGLVKRNNKGRGKGTHSSCST